MKARQLRPVGERVALPAWREVLTAQHRKGSEQLRSLRFTAAGNADREYVWLSSATAALAVALRAAAEARAVSRPEVIVPAFACPDIVAAANHAGVRPVLADFARDSLCMDPLDVAAAVSSQTVALVSVRLLGLPGNSSALRSVIGPGCALIEDCAHVLPQQALDTQADAIVVSFGRGKPVSLRSGGTLILNRSSALVAHLQDVPPHPGGLTDAILHVVRAVLYNGVSSPRAYWWLSQVLGWEVDVIACRPLRGAYGFPDHLAGALGRALAISQRVGGSLASIYSDMLQRIGGPWTDVGSSGTQRFAGSPPAAVPALWRYPLLLDSAAQRDRLFARLWSAGLGPSRLYRRTLSDMPEIAGHVSRHAQPNARSIADRLLTLPLHSDVTAADTAAMEVCLRQFAAGTLALAAVGDGRSLCMQ